MNMIERVTRAIAGADLVGNNSYECYARAAIEAMREPTEATIKAAEANDVKYVGETSRPEEYWPLMIDAALNEKD